MSHTTYIKKLPGALASSVKYGSLGVLFCRRDPDVVLYVDEHGCFVLKKLFLLSTRGRVTLFQDTTLLLGWIRCLTYFPDYCFPGYSESKIQMVPPSCCERKGA